MKKLKALSILLAAFLLCAVLVSACGVKPDEATYTVTFDLNGGELISGKLVQKVSSGESAVPPEARFDDKILSWNGSYTNITEDTTVVARWTEPTFTVTFDPNGGQLVSGELVQQVRRGESAVPPEVTNGTMKVTWNGSYTNITGDTTVTASWEKTAMDTADLASYVQGCTVTISATRLNGKSVTGSGFFIDSNGTIVTNFHVINLAESISVQLAGGGIYPVQYIVDFDNTRDVAVLKIDVTGQPYLELADTDIRTGEQVYAVGSALGTLTGTFTGGNVSSTSRTYGAAECIQMDAAISSGNSGGPLVNVYGEVVGINTASYTAGDNLNLAIKISTLKNLSLNRNWSMTDFVEWYEQESSRSWSPRTSDGGYNYSLVNNYQRVTGAACLYSIDDDNDVLDGYYDTCRYYVYSYNAAQYDQYTTYLKSVGYQYQQSESFTEGISYYYYNEMDNIMLDLFVLNDFSQIWIFPTIE